MLGTKSYATPENFTPPLEIMEVTFRRSGWENVMGRLEGAGHWEMGQTYMYNTKFRIFNTFMVVMSLTLV